jgi:hypothetical protein
MMFMAQASFTIAIYDRNMFYRTGPRAASHFGSYNLICFIEQALEPRLILAATI